MRKKIAAGNWKMNLSPEEAAQLYLRISQREDDGVLKLVFPPSIYIQKLLDIKGTVKIGTQNFHPEEKGAFTGEVSVKQFSQLGVEYFLVGHSERRMYFEESNSFLKSKVNAAIQMGGTVVFCCGEPLDVRESGTELEFVKDQLTESLFHLSKEQIRKCIIAYEPVWAIGTGKTASSGQAEAMHSSIRNWVQEFYGVEIADAIPILYGGSCNASNAAELFSCPNVDGGLIGGAALDASSYLSIVDALK